MQYVITHKCGHETMAELFGKGAERERKIERMEAEECPECRAAHDEAKGLARLVGSPKQIAWASDIREDMLARVAEEVRDRVRSYSFDWDSDLPAPENVRENYFGAQILDSCILDILRGISTERSAKWFIDHRDARLHQLSQMFKFTSYDQMVARYNS